MSKFARVKAQKICAAKISKTKSVMILFFKSNEGPVLALETGKQLTNENITALCWLFGNAKLIKGDNVKGYFTGPRREMITPWSTTAVEITQNMNISGIRRIEEYFPTKSSKPEYDKMLQRFYNGLDQNIFTVDKKPDPIVYISNLEEYNVKEGLALNPEEIQYLNGIAKKIGRKLTDSEVFGFSQVNSEHCRHKIFNGTFVIDGKEMESSLFKLIKKTSKENPNLIVSAYKDNCAFLEGPKIKMFHPADQTKPDFFKLKEKETVISLKAETHNFPTTVEPFNGAATGTGGEIRDRMGGGKGSFPIAGTAVYMTSYPRFDSKTVGNNKERKWEKTAPRKWLYQSPQEILTKASNGASDFGNKFGQCIICGSLLTFEHIGKQKGVEANNPDFGYDKVIMQAGGIGYAKKSDAAKETPEKGDKIVLLGGDNYRIGMGGGAVSSVNTGKYGNDIELNAIQRANPEMQKRDYNAIRALSEKENNPIVSVHDHGAGGHLNCFSELVEDEGGKIDTSKLPIGDPTLSLKEIIGNESQERMGLAMHQKDITEFKQIAERERAPFYEVGEVTGDHRFTLKDEKSGNTAIDLEMADMFGSSPKTFMHDRTAEYKFNPLKYSTDKFEEYLTQVLQLESVACKDWLTNKVDRSVTGLVACQQCTGEIQLPLNDLGVTAIGYDNKEGIATSIGHAPIIGLIDSAAGSRMSVAEALTNAVWTPLKNGLKGISLSANWMWPSRNTGEDARLYKAVKAVSDFACALGINIPTGKDSMSMTQNYPDGKKIIAPGTLIISSVAPVKDVNNIIHPNLQKVTASTIVYLPFSKCEFKLGGSAFAQTLGAVGNEAPDVESPEYFADCFNTVQKLIEKNLVLAGHDISAGGLITSLLEMCFANKEGGIKLTDIQLPLINFMFSERPGVLLQIADKNIKEVEKICNAAGEMSKGPIEIYKIGKYIKERKISILGKINLNIDKLRDVWYKTSYLLDRRQSGTACALKRYKNYKKEPLKFKFPKNFSGSVAKYLAKEPRSKAPVAAIIREKGSNGEREMAWALYLAGFRVKDVHMTDLISGRETLKNVQFIVFVGGFSNADTLGSAKGWAGAFLYNEKANKALNDFYARKDTISLGVCNGCQLMAELGLITPLQRELSPKMTHNLSGKFESKFVGVEIPQSSSILLKSLTGSKLGIWVAHGDGRFTFPNAKLEGMKVAVKYNYDEYPGNPNGSPKRIAGVCSTDGRHLAMMPHPERCIRPWNWAWYPETLKKQEITPWYELFVNGRKWCEKHKK